MPLSFLEIARRLSHLFQQRGLAIPRITLTFDTVGDARRAWHSVLDEFPEWSLYPDTKALVDDGEATIHGITFRFEPFE